MFMAVSIAFCFSQKGDFKLQQVHEDEGQPFCNFHSEKLTWNLLKETSRSQLVIATCLWMLAYKIELFIQTLCDFAI